MPPKVDIVPANAHLVGLWLQLFAGGAYFLYLPQCFAILRKKVRDGLSIWLPIVCVLMFLIVAVDLVTEMVRAWDAFSVAGAKGEVLANPAKFYSNPATPESLVKNSITVALAVISDGIIVYRTFVVWNFSILIIAVPVGLLCADVGTSTSVQIDWRDGYILTGCCPLLTALGIWSTWTLSRSRAGDILILAEVTIRVKYFFIVTFCLNALCAALICWKIWHISSRVASYSSSDRKTTRVFEVMVESAAFYCAHLFALIVSSAIGSNVFFIFLDCLPPVTALVFTMIIVRARTGTQAQLTSTTAAASNLRFWSTTRGSATAANQPIGVEIDLERVVHTDSDVFRSTRDTYDDSERNKADF
ncbi:hypothetical protein C8Q74DRAFT_1220819 [Fomes fomentarius]|nr:hypothetical protein C8Q74DRAFT_1220819 [Fomes fomentarius]